MCVKVTANASFPGMLVLDNILKLGEYIRRLSLPRTSWSAYAR